MPSIGSVLLRLLATFLGATAVVGHVTYLDALSWHVLQLSPPLMGARVSGAFLTLLTAHAVVSVVAAGLGIALVLHEGPRQAAARALGLTMASWSYLLAYSGITLFLRPAIPGVWRSLFEGHFLLVELVGLVGILRFTALFPEPLPKPAPAGPSGLSPLMRLFHAVTGWMLRPAAPWLLATAVAAALWAWTVARGLPVADAALNPGMDLFRVTATGLAVYNLRRSWTIVRGEGADRMGWLLVALSSLIGLVLLYVGANVLLGVTQWPEPNLAWRPLLVDLGVLGFLVALATSVLYRGTADPREIARRVVSLAAVGSFGLFLAAALEAVLAGGILTGVSLRTGIGTIVAFTGVVATHRNLARALERALDQIPLPR